MPWLLAYAHVLQGMGEATDERTWWPSGVCFTLQISLLVDVFIQETGAELVEADIASCWGQLLEEVPCQKDEGPFMEVISHLDELAQHMPNRKAWDKLIFPTPPAELHAPCQSRHLGYIMGPTMDQGSTLPPLQFHISSPNGEFICIVQGLLFKGSVLTYDPATNGAKWVPMWGTASNLSPVEEVSAQELSNIVIHDPLEDTPRMDHFGKCRRSMVQRPLLIPSTWTLLSMRRSQWNRHPSLTWERRAAKAQKSQTPPKAPHATTPQGAATLTASAGQMKIKRKARNKKKLRGRSS